MMTREVTSHDETFVSFSTSMEVATTAEPSRAAAGSSSCGVERKEPSRGEVFLEPLFFCPRRFVCLKTTLGKIQDTLCWSGKPKPEYQGSLPK